MIAYLSGEVLKKESDHLVLLNSGIGYKIFSTELEINELSLNSKVEFWISENIKEDKHDLFGFTSPESLQLFEKILSVNGAGPKAALSILNIGPLSELKSALINSNAKYIQQASGVGKKLAERLILELSGRLSDTALDNSISPNSNYNEDDEAFQALVSLGYAPKDASKALEKVDLSLSTEERIKKALHG
ncbi:MAG: holliday junction helicase RuvA [Patescibacteria group bacterium]|nr:holliday junction helicase RuvA [Patescibacteria group bacterium]